MIAFQISFNALFRVTDGVRQLDLGQIMGIQTLNVTLVSAGHGFLRLYNFQVVGDSSGETVLRLCEGLFRQVDGTTRNFYLLRSRIQIEKRGANLVVDLPTKISQPGASLLQLSIRFENIPMDAVAGKDGNVESAIHLPSPVRLGRR